jgi:hypothetical protein
MQDLDMIIDVYAVLKEYVPSKERQAAADHVVGVIADYNLTDNDLKAVGSVDKYLGRAVTEYLGDCGADVDEDTYYDDGD